MKLQGINAIVTGGGSGLGLATARHLASAGATVTIVDLPTSAGEDIAASLGAGVAFMAADVTCEDQVGTAVEAAAARGPIRAVVHCAGRGRPMRILAKDGSPTALDSFASVIELNVVGTYNVLRTAAAAMARNELLDGDRGVCILTASVAAFEGQIGQINYAAAKAAVVGMTLPAARDLASNQIRVCTIAPGTFDTPLLASAKPEVRASLEAAVPHPKRLGDPVEFASLAAHILENPMLNGETIRLDGAIRMAPR